MCNGDGSERNNVSSTYTFPSVVCNSSEEAGAGVQPSSPHLPAFFNAPILRCPSAAVRAIVHELNCFVQSNDRNISIFSSIPLLLWDIVVQPPTHVTMQCTRFWGTKLTHEQCSVLFPLCQPPLPSPTALPDCSAKTLCRRYWPWQRTSTKRSRSRTILESAMPWRCL